MEQRELRERYLRDVKVRRSADVCREMRDLKGWSVEAFVVFCLDAGNRILSRDILSVGILDALIVHPREVFRTAIDRNAKSVIVAHNHPSGRCNPSKEDASITRRLRKAGDVLGIRLLDHVIVAGDSHYSFAENGELGGSAEAGAQMVEASVGEQDEGLFPPCPSRQGASQQDGAPEVNK